MSFELWLLLHIVIGFPLGLVVGNFGEWIIHRNVLHKRGKRKGNFWNFHWYDHHAEARKNGMIDPAYHSTWLQAGWNSRSKEATALILGAIPWVVLFPWAPGFCAAALYTSWNYYWVHKRAHLDPEWARTHLPWHVDHHMGPDQDKNWCVTRPWFDVLFGTRVKYVGTEAEATSKRPRRRDRAPHTPEAEAPAG